MEIEYIAFLLIVFLISVFISWHKEEIHQEIVKKQHEEVIKTQKEMLKSINDLNKTMSTQAKIDESCYGILANLIETNKNEQ